MDYSASLTGDDRLGLKAARNKREADVKCMHENPLFPCEPHLSSWSIKSG